MAWLFGVIVVVLLVAMVFVFWARQGGATPEELARIEASAATFLATHHDAIEATRRPVVRIALSPMDTDELFASKVGGAAWWPADEPLPVDAKGHALVLLAQVDLAEVPDSGLDLPTQGLLQFLVSTSWNYGQDYSRDQSPEALAARRGHRVVYRLDTSAPAQPIAAATKKQLPLDATQPLRLRFKVGTEMMGQHDGRFDAIFPGGLDSALEAHYEATGIDEDSMRDAIWDRDIATGHKLGGYPHFTQDDPRDRADLELLFQLDSDDGVMWGDAGVGNFFITDADLAKRDFSRVLYSWDCC
ncbi:MAG: YwqG family protein [Arenimonas sp.]